MPDTPSLTVRRKHERQRFDAESLDQLLAEGAFAHVALVRDGLPIVLPYLYAVGELDDGLGRRLFLHGSTGGGLFLDAGTEGVPISVGITHLDGFVFARSLNDSSANYRSAMIFGRATVVPLEHRLEALWLVGDHLMPGRRAEVREISAKELAQTQVLQVPLDHASVKVRFQGVGELPDDGEDHSVWAGVLPVALRASEPITSELTDAASAVSPAVEALAAELDERAASHRAALLSRLS